MPQSKSAIKRMKTSEKCHIRNKSVKTELKTYNKKLRESANDGKKEDMQTLLNDAYSKYDKAAKKKIIHPKNASRNKAKLAKLFTSKPVE
ncbi:30S ribosomal protein S20 [Chlamydiota bacterium]